MPTKTAVPTDAGELEEILNDSAQLAEIAKTPQNLGEFIKNYVQTQKAKQGEALQAQVKEQAQIVLAEMLEQNGAKTDLPINLNPMDGSNSLKYHRAQNKRAVGAPLNGLFEDVGEYFGAVWHQGSPKGEMASKLEKIRDYQEKVPAEGGFLVPEEFRAELLRLSLEQSVVRSRARIVPMSSATLRFPAIDESSRASSVFGGITVYRTEEGAELTESAASFASIKLEPTKQTALAHVTNELVRDAAGGFAMYIEEMFPQAISFFEDVDFLQGSGVGEPLGALTTGNGSRILKPRTTASRIQWPDIVAMYARMLPQSLNTAAWVVSQEALPELFQMTVNVDGGSGVVGGSAVYITDATGTPTLSMLGRPIIVTEKAGQLGTAGDVNFVDFGYYLVGDRQMMTVDSSPHVKFTSDKTTYRVIQRNDGRPWLQNAITPQNGGDTLSPFVSLDSTVIS